MSNKRLDRKRQRRRQQAEGHAGPGSSNSGERQPTLAARWTPFALALVTALLYWAALPPLGWWPLGWLAPLGWLVLLQLERLPGRRPYWGIYFASVLFWIVTIQGIRLAHWANYLALVALSLYLGIYLPLSVALARVALHRWRVPLIITAPAVWVGLEVARGYGPLGFSIALLAHTQVTRLAVIQVADLFGIYTVSFVVMFTAACAVRTLPLSGRNWSWWPALPLIAMVVLVLGYGQFRLTQSRPLLDERVPLRVAIIQGSIDTVFDDDPQRPREAFEQYDALTARACDRLQPLDLVMWPETMFPNRDVLVDEGQLPQIDPPLDRQQVDDAQYYFRNMAQIGCRRLNESADSPGGRPTSWVFGASTWQFGDHPVRRYNAALLANPQGEIAQRYYKMHPVIFGEYVPFGDTFPSLYNLFPLPNGLTPGTEPVAWELNGLVLSPNICFENTMPHLVRWQVAELARRGQSPDVLINVTNDGWFWGSSILDLQLDCAIFRAVELRRPFLVAANTGLSAWIDGNGALLAQGPRRETDVLLAEVVPDGRRSMYELWGDVPALFCTLFCLAAAVAGLWSKAQATRAGRRTPDLEGQPTPD